MPRHESRHPSRQPSRRPSGPAVLLGLALLLGTAGVVGCEARPGSSASPGSSTTGEPVGQRPGLPPRGESSFDLGSPEVAGLQPALLDALEAAATEAARDRIVLRITSGWRSAEHQQELFEQAVDDHGSEEEAAEWVAPPGTSAHETGGAVDIGPYDALDWLSRHGAAHGLCQVYDNEPWHFELRPDAVERGCPATYADPSEDPRLQ